MSDDAVKSKAVFFLLFLLLLVVFSAVARAQPAFQVEDLNTTRSAGIHPEFTSFFLESFAALEGAVFFAGSDGIQGIELWRTDGTDAGTRLVADICPGSCASVPRHLTVAGVEVFFLADDGLHGDALWKSDGTSAGTVLVRDLTPEGQFAWLQHLSGLEDLVLFSVVRGNGTELWRSDGTAAGTFSVASFGTNYQHAPEPLARLGGKLLFAANDGSSGKEPWVTDGTAAGTFLLKDLSPGASDGLPGNLRKNAAVAGGKVFFGALSGLWTSDGTVAGTAMVEGVFPQELIALGGKVFFFGSDGSISGLWKSDGTATGTVPVKPLPFRVHLTSAGGRLFFFSGCELWTSDGTEAGTVLVEAIPSPPVPGCYPLPSLTDGAEGGGKLLFFADDGIHGRELWASDGTPAGTGLAADLYPGPSSSVSEARRGLFAGGRWYFRAKSGEDVGDQLWTSDGTAAGTRMLRIHHQQSGLLVNRQGRLEGPRAFFDLNGTLLFQGDDGATGAELWRSDGTAAGTSLVKDLQPGPSLFSSLPAELTRAGDTVFFRSDAGTRESKLWRTDGTPEGTLLLFTSVQPPDGPIPFSPRDLTPLGDDLLFIGPALGYSDDLMKSDGTPEGTVQVGAAPGIPFLYPSYLDSIVSLGGKVLFQMLGDQLWVSDGSSAGTKPLGTLLPGDRLLSESSAVLDGVLFFAGFTNAGGEKLWRSDGTASGTYEPGHTVLPLPGTERLGPFATAGPYVFFAEGGNVLQKTDGDVIHFVRALPGNPEIGIRSLTGLGNKVYFSYNDGVHGRELWVSDGTEAGTRMVEDIFPGPGSSHPRDFRVEGNVLLFSASDGVHGFEPWRSNGTAVGTRMLHDIAPGGLPSSPTEFTASGLNIYFAANDGTTGFELWALPKPALLSTFADVPTSHWSWSFVEAVAASGLTGGCGQDNYCPDLLLKRAEAAVFLVKASHGAGFVPPPATGTVFNDAPAGYWAAPWIEQLAADGVTSGCGNGNFCPETPLKRAEAAVFLLRARYGSAFVPPPATGTVFNDVPAGFWAAPWIERLAAEGVTTGCGGGNYCPDRAVSRAEMAVFLTRMFALPLP